MQVVAHRFGVPVVERIPELEGDEMGWNAMTTLRMVVRQWQHCEGVVIRFTDGSWVKVKSQWWEDACAGYSSGFTEKIAYKIGQARLKLQQDKRRYQHHSLRLAVTLLPIDANPGEIKHCFPAATKIQMVACWRASVGHGEFRHGWAS